MGGRTDVLAQRGFAAESAETHMGFAPGGRWGDGTYSAQELARLGVFPQSGALACTTNCHCRLVAAQRPAGSPEGAPADRQFRSLQPKEFTGTRREGTLLVVTRAHAHEARKRYARRAMQTTTRYEPRKR